MTDKLQSILQAEGLEHLLPTLVDQGVVDSMLLDLSESDLKSLGVDKLGERKRLLAALTATRSANEAQSAPAKSSEDGTKNPRRKIRIPQNLFVQNRFQRRNRNRKRLRRNLRAKKLSLNPSRPRANLKVNLCCSSLFFLWGQYHCFSCHGSEQFFLYSY